MVFDDAKNLFVSGVFTVIQPISLTKLALVIQRTHMLLNSMQWCHIQSENLHLNYVVIISHYIRTQQPKLQDSKCLLPVHAALKGSINKLINGFIFVDSCLQTVKIMMLIMHTLPGSVALARFCALHLLLMLQSKDLLFFAATE